MTSDRLLRATAATVLFVNAFLLFVLQPHISRRLLPVLGGSAEVWIVCTLFFQVALLAGYGAVYLSRRLPLTAVLAFHALLIGVAWLFWPFTPGDGPPAGASPPLWTLRVLITQVGLLFTVLSATSPLLQAACARAAPNLDPYPLFAASNAGSLAGLFSYPLLVEPLLTLEAQARAWSVAALGLLVLLGLAGSRLAGRATATGPATAPGPAPTRRQRARWLALSFVPSVLMLAVTAQITLDIAPVPLLWMLPLGLYLGSFIQVFRQGWQPSRWTWAVLAVTSLPMLLTFVYEATQWWWVPVHLAILWSGAVLCHGMLVQERPEPGRLSQFYLWLALGGALGGLFAGIAAPLFFTWRAEYPLAVLALLWLAPREPAGGSQVRLSWRLGLGLTAIAVAAAAGFARATSAPAELSSFFVLVPAAAAVVTWHRPRLFAGFATVALVAIVVGRMIGPSTSVVRGRTFYGTYVVRDLPDAHARGLFHGTTLHGLQSLLPERRREPLSYYGVKSPLGDVFQQRGGPEARVAIVGLGAGIMLRYAKPGSEWTVYEIDPAIVRVAQDRALFTHWSEAAVPPTLVVGDGRLGLREAPDGAYDLIVVDAFASDSIPVHMLTREAMALYARKLRDDGAALFHVSNRYVDLTTVVGATVPPLGLVAYRRDDSTDDVALGIFPSSWVLVGRQGRVTLPTPEWRAVEVLPTDRGWTDDYSNVFAAFGPVRRARELIAAFWGN